MTCVDLTIVTGFDRRGEPRRYFLLDHLDREAAERQAHQLGLRGEVEINHTDTAQYGQEGSTAH